MHTVRGHTQRVSWYSREGEQVVALSGLWTLMASILCALAMEHPAQAAVFTIPAGDVAALINAVNAANGNGEEDTIHLAAGTYTLTAVDNDIDDFGPNGLPAIISGMTIRGAGADVTRIVRDATAPLFRIFNIAETGILLLDDLTITGGNNGNPEGGRTGGGIINFGTLTLTNSIVTGNSAGAAGGMANAGTLTLTHSTVSGNTAVTGGGIHNFGGTVTLANSIVTGNSVSTHGGGIYNEGILILTHSTVSGNTADGIGGGIFQGPSGFSGNTVTLTHSTVSGNTANGPGGGGGIFNSYILTLTNSTVSGNTAVLDFSSGGGIRNDFGTVTLSNSTISGNSSFGGTGGIDNTGGTLTLTHTIVAGNTPADCLNAPDATLASLGHNLVGAGTGCPSNGPGDLTVDPDDVFTTVLGPLQA